MCAGNENKTQSEVCSYYNTVKSVCTKLSTRPTTNKYIYRMVYMGEGREVLYLK